MFVETIIEVSVIRSEDGHRLRVGNDCIDSITNRRVSRWFKNCRRKRVNVIRNRKYIDELSLILKAYRRSELAFQITDCDVEKLSMVLERMINGLNPDRREEQMAECYIRKKGLDPGICITGCKLATSLIVSKHEFI
jgi:hypothetical protein